MLDAKALANAGALVTLTIFGICVVLAAAAPDLLFGYAALTTHGLNLEPLRLTTVNLNMVNVLGGALLLAGSTWLTLYVTVALYNSFKK